MMPVNEKLIQLKKQCAAYQKQAIASKVRADTADLAREKAEQALRSLDRQYAATRDRLKRAEAYLRSLGAMETTE